MTPVYACARYPYRTPILHHLAYTSGAAAGPRRVEHSEEIENAYTVGAGPERDGAGRGAGRRSGDDRPETGRNSGRSNAPNVVGQEARFERHLAGTQHRRLGSGST